MNEQEQRSQAALQEMSAINQMLVQRCVNLAAEIAVLGTKQSEYAQKFEALQKEVEALKDNKE